MVGEKYPELAGKIETYRHNADEIFAKEPTAERNQKKQVMAWVEIVQNMVNELRGEYVLGVFGLNMKSIQRLTREIMEEQAKNVNNQKVGEEKELLIRENMVEAWSDLSKALETWNDVGRFLEYWRKED